MSRHEKFKVYWESMGRPDIECKYHTEPDAFFSPLQGDPRWADHCDYRMAGDKHWELRLKWIDSAFTLPIERKSHLCSEWVVTKEPFLYGDAEYREAKAETSINDHQPEPEKNDNPAAWSLVIADMVDRDIVGVKRYGTRLQPHNGRDALIDAYQEVLDAAVYLRQAIFERDGK